jgi:hypothetical protein
MDSKSCSKCKELKPLKNYAKNRNKKGEQFHRAMCNTCRNSRLKNGYYYIYYLPNENYCGITDYVARRISIHKNNGKNVDNYRLLYCSKDKKEAAYHEILFQSVLAMEGLPMTMFRN